MPLKSGSHIFVQMLASTICLASMHRICTLRPTGTEIQASRHRIERGLTGQDFGGVTTTCCDEARTVQLDRLPALGDLGRKQDDHRVSKYTDYQESARWLLDTIDARSAHAR
ncbi:hypothetical protein B0H17DRAFT_1196692 [Mycena rosella]|uniref:Secreted protein n=1 Tax=Mycena rosella TaxID=1033263 RepID=A0AAD7GMZ1_MYCRO|nr:hypothetical protein B0H17DRAFT_1196692 [Mycena rosella]